MDDKHSLTVTETKLLAATRAYVHELMTAESSGHDWWHVDRVTRTALEIGKLEGADLFVVELAALLHDIGDYKLHGGDETMSERMITDWLSSQDAPQKLIEKIVTIVEQASFSKRLKSDFDPTALPLETKVLHDADKLDAIGAIGVARAFAFGGHFQRPLYDPTEQPREELTMEAYKNRNQGSTIAHFYEKLLKLKGIMLTKEGLRRAENRHRFLEHFLEQFYAEWAGQR